MPSLFDQIAGYQEAVQRDNTLRLASFSDVPEILCGCDVRPLTLNHLVILECSKSPFLYGMTPDAGDVALFIWIVSVDYTPSDSRAAQRFARRLRRADYIRSIREIEDYINEAFADAPGVSSDDSVRIHPTSWPAVIVDMLASEYGWTQHEIMHTPLKRLWQLQRRIRLRVDPRAVFINPSDKVRGDWMKAQNERTAENVN